MQKKTRPLQLRMTYPVGSDAHREHLAANEDTRFSRLREYALSMKGRELEALVHAGLYEIPAVQALARSVGVRALPMARPVLITSLPAAKPHSVDVASDPLVALTGEAAIPAAADTKTDTAPPSANIDTYSAIDVGEWMK